MKSANELKYLAEQKGWQVGPLTFGKIQRMNSDEARFNELFNKAEYEQALDEPRIKAESKKNAEATKAQRTWADQASEEETAEALQEVNKFVASFPQFRADFIPNREALISFLRSKTLPCTARNLAYAFEDLASKGKLLLSAAAIGLGPEEDLSGYKLMRHPQLHVLLAPGRTDKDKTRLAEQKMSADEYRKQHPEAFRDPRVYAEAAEKIKREINSFRSFHPEYLLTEENSKHLQAYISKRKLPFNRESLEAAYGELVRQGYIEINHETVVSSGGTKLVDYGGRPGRANLSHEINRMSAVEYARWLENPANRRLVDDLTVA